MFICVIASSNAAVLIVINMGIHQALLNSIDLICNYALSVLLSDYIYYGIAAIIDML